MNAPDNRREGATGNLKVDLNELDAASAKAVKGRGDTIELSVGDDEQSETAWVPMTHVARITPVAPKKASGDTASLLVEAVWEN